MMPATIIEKSIKIRVLLKSDRESNRLSTSFFMRGILLTVLNGLRTRNSLNPLKDGPLELESERVIKKSIRLIITIIKSRQFQKSLK